MGCWMQCRRIRNVCIAKSGKGPPGARGALAGHDLENVAIGWRRFLVVDVVEILRQLGVRHVGRNREFRGTTLAVVSSQVGDPIAADAFDGNDSSEDVEAVSHVLFVSRGGWLPLNTANWSANARW